jgi:hypothetical protein
MFISHFLSRFGAKPASRRTPKLEAALEALEELSETLSDQQLDRLRMLSGEDYAAISDYLRLFRAAAIFQALKFRGPQDGAVAELFVAFYSRHFEPLAMSALPPPDELQRRAEDLLVGALGRALALALAEQSQEAAQLLAKGRDLATLYARFSDYLARSYGRLEPASRARFDESAYLAANPDVAAAVERGEAPSGRSHFDNHGAAEGRSQRVFGGDDGLCRQVAYPLNFRRCAYSTRPAGDLQDCDLLALDSLLAMPPSKDMALALCAAPQRYDAASSFDRDPEIGAESPYFEKLANACAWRSGALYFAAFRDALADVENGIVLYDADKIWGDSAQETLLYVGGLARAPDIFLLDGRYGRLEFEKPARVEGPALLATSWATRNNYGHWLMNGLLSVYLAREPLSQGRLKLLTSRLPAHLRQQLLQLGVPAESIVEIDGRYARCDHLLYPSPLSTSGNIAPHESVKEFFAFLQQQFPARHGLRRPRLAYVSREGFPSQRRMVNETQLYEALAPLGFDRVAPHELDFADQIHCLSRAQIVIGQFGAALWNAAFSPRGARLIEIATTNYGGNEYLCAAHLTGRRFSRIMIEPEFVDPDNAQICEFHAPIAEVVEMTRALMERDSTRAF